MTIVISSLSGTDVGVGVEVGVDVAVGVGVGVGVKAGGSGIPSCISQKSFSANVVLQAGASNKIALADCTIPPLADWAAMGL